ncbi:MAG: carbohydrate-binding domain-containing protein [Microgenomates group bacterium]
MQDLHPKNTFPQSDSTYVHLKKRHLLGFTTLLFFLITGLFVVLEFNAKEQSISPNAIFAQAQSTATFIETFDGKPGAPEPFSQLSQSRWDVQIHSRNNDTWEKMVPMKLHHAPNCGSPLIEGATAPYNNSELMTHDTDGTYEDAVFRCNDHVMTGINGVGKSINDSYALAVLTPNHMVDFTEKEATIRFNVTTFRTTQRDWIDIWITPWEDNLALPFDTGEVDLQGMPRNTIQVTMMAPNDNSKTGFRPKIIINGKDTGEFQMHSSDYNWYTPYEDFLPGKSGDPKRRDTFEIKISKNHISVCMPQDTSDNAPSQTICWANKTIQTLPFTKGVVQFAHHSYTPNKDCNFYSPLTCGADTWHWDDFVIDPAVPFTMIKADRRMVTTESTPVTFQAPAPAQSKLRFSAIGSVQLSFDGTAFKSVSPQLSTNPNAGHVANYFVDIPTGTKTVAFKLGNTGAGVHAKDFAIWTQNTSVVIPSASPSPITSPIATVIASPVASPIASVPASPVLSPSPVASPVSSTLPSASPVPISPTPTTSPPATPKTSPQPSILPSVIASPVVTPSPSVAPQETKIAIYAAGTSVFGTYPTVELEVNGKSVQKWKNVRGDTLKRVFEVLQYTSASPVAVDQVRVKFTNDFSFGRFGDRNLQVDKISINGIDYQTEHSSTYSTGSWNSTTGCAAGYKSSEWLHCNGYFAFPSSL